MVEFLIKKGAAVKKATTDGRGFTPLLEAAWTGNGKVVKLLVEEGHAEVDQCSKDRGTSPLFLAALRSSF